MEAKDFLEEIDYYNTNVDGEQFEDLGIETLADMLEVYHQKKLKLLGIGVVVGSALVEIDKPYIEDAENVLRGDIYTVDGRVSKCWILETDFDDIKCTHN
tara:strand:- start:861 stop:1160 length:300 start_codon:yes stop_codon:yes gene_type:complete